MTIITLGDRFDQHVAPALVLTNPQINAQMAGALVKRFTDKRPDPDLVRTWPQIGRDDLPYTIHRQSVKEMAVLHKSTGRVMFFRDPEWTIPLIHPKAAGRGVGTEALVAEMPFDDRPAEASSYSLAGFALEQSAWRLGRERQGLPVPAERITPEDWNRTAFRRLFDTPSAAIEDAQNIRAQVLKMTRGERVINSVPMFCYMAQADQQVQTAKQEMTGIRARLNRMVERVRPPEPSASLPPKAYAAPRAGM